MLQLLLCGKTTKKEVNHFKSRSEIGDKKITSTSLGFKLYIHPTGYTLTTRGTPRHHPGTLGDSGADSWVRRKSKLVTCPFWLPPDQIICPWVCEDVTPKDMVRQLPRPALPWVHSIFAADQSSRADLLPLWFCPLACSSVHLLCWMRFALFPIPVLLTKCNKHTGCSTSIISSPFSKYFLFY